MDTLELSKKLIKIKKYYNQPGKAEAVDLIANIMEKNGLHVEFVKSNGVASVIGSTKGRKENSKKIILNGHYDTVPPSDQWTVDPFDPVVKNGELWGLGSCDMTCNLAAMINTAINVSKQNPNGEVILVAVGDEEVGGHNGTRATIEKGIIADYVIIGEPTTMRLATGHKARLQIELIAEGKGGHAAYPQDTNNAVHRMATALIILEKEFELKSHDHEYVFSHPTMNTTLISGGTAENVVPFECKATIDFRLPANVKVEKFTAKLTKLLPDHMKLKVEKSEVGWVSDENSAFIKTAKLTLEKITGTPVNEYMHKLGASDARFYSKAGIPTINVGAGNMKLHIPDEKMQLEQLKQVEQFYLTLCKKIIG